MARSTIQLKTYRTEILHECNQTVKTAKFPAGLMNRWIHKDIVETIVRLGGAINQLYRTTAQLAVTSGKGWFDSSVSHTAAAVLVTGFTGLTPDDWIGGTAIFSDAADGAEGTLYAAQIADNDATTISLVNGTDLPAITTKPILLTRNNSGSLISLASLSMINYAEPIWEVLTDAGVPVSPMPIDLAQNIQELPQYNGTVFYHVLGQSVKLVLGLGATASGTWTVGYYVLPVEATADTDYIDFPQEFHNLAQMKTIIRVLKSKGMEDVAAQKERELEQALAGYDDANMGVYARDKASGERK